MTGTPDHLTVRPDRSLRAAMAAIDLNQKGIVLVVDGERRLLGTITDGDVRRALLAGRDLDAPIAVLLAAREVSPYPQPVTAAAETSAAELLVLMKEREVHQIPLLDGNDRVVGLVTLDELVPDSPLGIEAVVMAGGSGSRLLPLTEELPKPMLPLGGRPLLERIVDQLRLAGISRLHLATHYKPTAIVDHFGNGDQFGVDIRYLDEERPLGTAGALRAVETGEEPLLVMNGDIVTGVNFRALLAFHREHRADMTVAVRDYKVAVPYGVVATDGPRVTGVTEKPILQHFINAGIYVLDPKARDFIPDGERCDMPDLIAALIAAGRTVVSFPIHEYWLDIGRPEEYERAQADLAEEAP